ncbi:MAG: leucine--tRNA ligase [Cytophagales bacterium]|nr:leucine--tRNA ligase [Cytophagales bacterium]
MSRNTKFYILNMFPYPSGAGLHVGHALGYVASDIFARYKKMKGYTVLNPMGFDSFGLPAEQYAILTGQHPAVTTEKNVQHYIAQMKKMELNFDWERKFNTSDPEYYKWTQWIFIQMFNSFYCKQDNKAHNIKDLYVYFSEHGTEGIEEYVSCKDRQYNFTSSEWNKFSEEKKYKISLEYRIAYLDHIDVNWCEELKTVLANDEVKNGVSERGGYPVIKKKMKQWVLRITAYADRLLNDLDGYKKHNIDADVKVFDSDLKPGLEIENRNIILAIIKHWEENKYLVIRYKQDNSRAFLTGGIEKNETSEEVLRREVKEETGYISLKTIKMICETKCTFYHKRKNKNLHELTYNYYVELSDSKRVDTVSEEKNILDFEWVKEDKIEAVISYKEHFYPFSVLKNDTEPLLWPESTKEMQRNWIGKSDGANINFKVEGLDYSITIFTSRPETIFGVTFLALAKNHYFVKRYCNDLDLKDLDTKTDDKIGVKTHYFAINPINNEKVTIWVANYILSDYGTGAIMAVPELDDRDYDFAKKYNITVKNIFHKDKFINSDFLNDLTVEEARKAILTKIKSQNIGSAVTTYRLRDAIFSRQRYWGEPIPIYYKDITIDGNIEKLPFTVEENDLPLKLPEVDNFTPTGEAPLTRVKNWRYKGYDLEVNTMPGWAGSSWYFLRYLDPHNDKELCSKEKIEEFENVDLYLGGSEHAVGHLLYSRFYTKFLYDLGYINFEEPFKKLIHQGMILSESAIIYRINGTNKFISRKTDEFTYQYEGCNPITRRENICTRYIKLVKEKGTTPVHIPIEFIDEDDLDPVHGVDNNDIYTNLDKLRQWREDFKNAEFLCGRGAYIVNCTGYRYPFFRVDRVIEKMSKSKHNVINPDDVIRQYGADVLRMYLMFLGPIEQSKPWDTKGIEGIARFLKRVNNITNNVVEREQQQDEMKVLHRCIKDVTAYIESYCFNTAISAMMICLNDFYTLENISKKVFKDYLLLLNSFSPETVNNLWNKLFTDEQLDTIPFPEYDEEYLHESTVQYAIMINGKTKTQVVIDKNASDKEIEAIVLNNAVVHKWLSGQEIKKIIIIKNKVVSIVIAHK